MWEDPNKIIIREIDKAGGRKPLIKKIIKKAGKTALKAAALPVTLPSALAKKARPAFDNLVSKVSGNSSKIASENKRAAEYDVIRKAVKNTREVKARQDQAKYNTKGYPNYKNSTK